MSAIDLVSPASSALDLAPQDNQAGPSRARAGSATTERPRPRVRALSEERSLGDRRTFQAARRGGGNRTYTRGDDAGSDNEIVFTGEHLAPARQMTALARTEGPIRQGPNERRINQVLHDLDQRLDHYRYHMNNLLNARALRDDPQDPPSPRRDRPVGFGAVMRAGDRSIHSVSTTAQKPMTPAQIRAIYAHGPHSWARFISDPLSNSPNPLPGVVFVPNAPRHEDFVVNFDPADDKNAGPIEIDDEGDIVPHQPHILRCANCPKPLLLSSAYRSPEDTVWVLRCGHMVEQSCLRKVAQPEEFDPAIALADAEAMIAGPGQRKRKRVTPRKPRKHVWHCPVESCGRPHISVEGPAPLYGWNQDEQEGALQLYA